MELYTMRYVVAVADAGNFSQAAQECHVGQPALSQRIARLEQELGVSLFFRGPRGAALTEAGEEFVRRARDILQRADSLQAEMSFYAGLKRGTLNLGIITSLQCIDFGGMLAAFCGTYPDISVNIIQDGTHHLIELLGERKLDIAFLNRPLGGLPDHLEFVRMGEDHYSLAVPRQHPLAKRGTVSLAELKEEHFIFHQSGQAAAELCRAACLRAGFEPNIVCRSSSPTTGLYMVQGGLGVAFLPSEEFRGHALRGVTELRLKERITKEVGVAWRKDTVSPLVAAAIRFAEEWTRSSGHEK
ncbi:LysR family transcriptional regulator [Yanshouia hominis]|uniref:LysR family transcriptional regulator n=1 Tax=Yanshouia hominis TaxID=2763673 RepID=A0ABR7NIX9_9FIRM|nr:LysR family transcriptional regulator [Yanshouia hominis]MBC8576367.1 LysR family transcriptional regulator [Yanshouia hominis]